MRKLSTFQIVLLAVFGALAVAGVLIFALAVGGKATQTLGPVTIWGTLDQGAFNNVIHQAAEKDPSLAQVTYVQKDAATYDTELLNALASGTGPDLFVMPQEYALKNASKAALIPFNALSQSQFENTFAEAASPFIAQDGILGIPIAADPLVLYWNKDLLASAGLSQPFSYWDELFGIAQKLTSKDETGSILKSAIAFGEYRNVVNAKDILATLILQAGGTITGYDTSGRLQPSLVSKTGGAASQASESALRFFTELADPSKDDYSWNRSLPPSQQAFAAGDVGFYIGYASEKAQIARMNPNLNFGVAPVPQIRGASRKLDLSTVYALAATKSGKNPSSAIAVAYILARSENAEALTESLGLAPARRDLLAKAATGDQDLFNKMVIISHSWLDPDPEETADIFRAMIEDTTSGAVLVAGAVSRADQQLGHLLNELQRE